MPVINAPMCEGERKETVKVKGREIGGDLRGGV